MANLTRAEMAERAGVTRQAIDQALKRGKLAAERDGRLDPVDPTNAHWLSLHDAGFDSALHVLDPAKASRAAVAHRGGNG
jgi:hypothetical protein